MPSGSSRGCYNRMARRLFGSVLSVTELRPYQSEAKTLSTCGKHEGINPKMEKENKWLTSLPSPRNPDSSLGGEVLFGGFDPSRFLGTLHWVPVTQQGYWQIQLDK